MTGLTTNQWSLHAFVTALAVVLLLSFGGPTANASAPEIIVDAATGVAVPRTDLDRALAEIYALAPNQEWPRCCGVAQEPDEGAARAKPQFTRAPWSLRKL